MLNEEHLGVEVTPLNMDEVLLKVNKIIVDNKKGFIVAINPEKIMKAQDDDDLKKLINSADIKIPDGTGVVIASKLRGGSIKSRVTGIDLMKNICFTSIDQGYKIFLLGGKKEVAKRASKVLESSIKGIDIVGIEDGYFEDKDLIIRKINESGANILFVALGSPKQENFIKENMDKINANIFMGVGGSFDVICGDINRAPIWIQKCGGEWFYRLLKEPSRIKRIKVLPKFIIKSLSRRG